MNDTDSSSNPPWNAGFDPMSTPQRVFTLTWGALAIFGLISNAFVLYAVPFELPTRTLLDLFIYLLAVNDFFSNALLVAITWTNGISGGWKEYGLCAVNPYLLGFCGAFNLFMLCTIARHRYLTVVYQQKPSRIALAINLLVVLLLALLFSTLQPMGLAAVTIHQSGGLCMFEWWRKGKEAGASIVGMTLFSTANCIMGYYYWRINKSFQRSSDKIRHLLRRRSLRKDDPSRMPLTPGAVTAGQTIGMTEHSNVKTNQVMPVSPLPGFEFPSNNFPQVAESPLAKLTIGSSSSSSGSSTAETQIDIPNCKRDRMSMTVSFADDVGQSPALPESFFTPVIPILTPQISGRETDATTFVSSNLSADRSPPRAPLKSIQVVTPAPFNTDTTSPSSTGNDLPTTISAFARRLDFERLLTRKTFALVVAFQACWLMYTALIFYEVISSNEADVYFDGTSNLCAELGICVNPVLYCVFDSRYKNALKRVIEKATCKRLRWQQEVGNQVEVPGPALSVPG